MSTFPRFERRQRCLVVGLVINRRIGKTVRSERLGHLGAVYGSPISVSERIRFWVAIDRHLIEIDAKHPGRVTPADVAKIRAAISRRIPLPSTAVERKLFFQAIVVRDAMAAFDALEHGEDAAAEATRALMRLAREQRPDNTDQLSDEGELLAPTNEERRP
jgi:hypothetical protein